MTSIRKLVDDEGENRALRSFLLYYTGVRAPTIGEVCDNMQLAGWDGFWPDFVASSHDRAELTKAGAQLWIRHLLELEARTPAAVRALAAAKVALEAARGSHGVALMSHPPRDAWMERGVDGKIRDALEAIKAVPA